MLTIRTAGTLEYIIATASDPALASILQRHQPHVEMAVLFIVQPGDRIGDLETMRGCPFELWEFITYEGGWYEAVFITSDEGSGHIVLIPHAVTTDHDLLNICRTHAVSCR